MANIKKLGQALRIVGDEIQKCTEEDIDQIEVLEEITQKLSDTSPNFGLCDITRQFNRHKKQKNCLACDI